MKNNSGLRKKAQRKLKDRPVEVAHLSQMETAKLIQELQIHQVELEMQNEEVGNQILKAEILKKKYKDLYDHAPVGYLSLDKNGKILDANLTVERFLNTHREILKNSKLYNFVVFKDRDILFLHLRNLFQTKKSQSSVLNLNCDNNNHFPAQLDSILINDESGDNWHARTSITDLTERVKNFELKLQIEKFEEVNRFKNELLSAIKHKLRSPLDAILSLTRTIRAKEELAQGSNHKEYIETVERNGWILFHHINEILDISEIYTIKEQTNLKKISLRPIMENICFSLLPLAANKGIKLKNLIREDFSQIVSDPGKVYKILTNIIGNAIKFTNHGQVEINGKEKEKSLEINVKGTGIEIAENEFPDLSGLLQQLDHNALTRIYEGAGLGLYIAQYYANQIGGKITYKSKMGKGSIFTITLPKDPREDEIKS